MPHFRAHPLDAAGRITGFYAFEAADDDEAMQGVGMFSDIAVVEVWSRTRKVGLSHPAERLVAAVSAPVLNCL